MCGYALRDVYHGITGDWEYRYSIYEPLAIPKRLNHVTCGSKLHTWGRTDL
jgi:hypothetical protein